MPRTEEKRILIWGKTYPELSSKYFETVCTGGVLEDGSPVRLYPIPYRYLEGDGKFERYQWIKARISPNSSDSRPESYRIERDSITCLEIIEPTKDEWGKRAGILFQNPAWLFDSVDELLIANRKTNQSLGVVTPKEIMSVEVKPRPQNDAKSFAEKLDNLRKMANAARDQLDLFEMDTPAEVKNLTFVSSRIQIRWRCASPSCKEHLMQILDWEVGELQRKRGDAAALEKVRSICNLDEYALKFYLGNLAQHPTAFTIVGLWYPKRTKDRLFL